MDDKREYSTTEEYIKGFPADIQAILESIRQTIKAAAPGAKEVISYRMPGFKLNNKTLVWFAAFKDHIGFFPTGSGVEPFKNKLQGYKISKGTIQFPLDKPIPYDLIAEITKFRMAEVSKRDPYGKPPFDLEQAGKMLNKIVLIGLTYNDHEGKFIEQKQMYGKVLKVDKKDGIEFKLEGSHSGEIFRLPPDLRSYKQAASGTYTLRSTGEEVVNPDYLATWVINKAPPDFKTPE